MGTLIMVGQVLLALGILVGLHEAGHMLAAKAFGMRVEKFSIGFPPKVFSFKKGETEYSLGAIPLGGFVKITGMMDESFDKEGMDKEPEPYEFRAKPAWQRLIVMMGGIIVNIITGVLIYIFVVFVWGKPYTPLKGMENGIHALTLAQELGLKNGDEILELNKIKIEEYESAGDLRGIDALLKGDGMATYTVSRTLANGKDSIFEVVIPEGFVERVRDESFWDIRRPFYVDTLRPNWKWTENHIVPNYAYQAGIKPKDKILEVDSVPVLFFDQLQDQLMANKGDSISLLIERDGKQLMLQSMVDTNGHLGFSPGFDANYMLDTAYYGFGASIAVGTSDAFTALYANMVGIWKMVTGKLGAKSLSGPVGIARMFGSEWRWSRFWGMTGLLSMILAFMNFLPIPALDGGHVLFLLYEMISGRKPSVKFTEIALKIGIVILIAIMIFAFGNDIIRLIFG